MSVKHSLLALLSTGPMYGQQLKDEFELRTGGMWALNVGQVYTTLGRLEKDGLVAEVVGDGGEENRRPYTITPGGQIELDLWLKSPGDLSTPPRDDLVMKVMIALSIDRDESREVMQSHRRQLLESMQQFTRLKGDDDATVASIMMCDAELFRLEAAVRWVDSVEARVVSGQLDEGARFLLPAASIDAETSDEVRR